MTDFEDEMELTDIMTEAEIELRNCRRVLEAGIWLIRNGWGYLKMLPYDAPSGCAWRCAFYPPGRPSLEFYRYTSASGSRFLIDHCGGSVRSTISAKSLAKAIIKSVPEHIARLCYGAATPETLRWLDILENYLDQGKIPIAFADWNTPNTGYWFVTPMGDRSEMIPCQPGYTEPGNEKRWFESEEWREALSNLTTLDNGEGFLLAFDNDELIDKIAHQMKDAMNEANDHDISRIFRASIARLWASINPEDYE